MHKIKPILTSIFTRKISRYAISLYLTCVNRWGLFTVCPIPFQWVWNEFK